MRTGRLVPDAVLIDRVFQPLSELLSCLGNCFDLARICCIALILDYGIVPPALYHDPAFVFAGPFAFVTTMLLFCMWGLGRIERRMSATAMNPLRHILVTSRLAYVAFVLRDAAGFGATRLDGHWRLWASMDVLGVVGVYFASCTPRPPMARRSRVPAALPQEAA